MSSNRLEHSLTWLSRFALVFSVGIVAWNWSELPDRIPLKFDALGEPKRWGPKASILILPAISVFVYGVLSFAYRQPATGLLSLNRKPSPARQRLQQSGVAWIRALVLLLLAYLTSRIVEVGQGKSADLGPTFFVLMGAVLLASVILSVKSFQTRGE